MPSVATGDRKQFDSQSEEINVIDQSQAGNRSHNRLWLLMEKSFLSRSLSLLCLAAAQEITHAAHSLSRLGELHVKAGYVSTYPSSRVARLAGAPSLHVNRHLREVSLSAS